MLWLLMCRILRIWRWPTSSLQMHTRHKTVGIIRDKQPRRSQVLTDIQQAQRLPVSGQILKSPAMRGCPGSVSCRGGMVAWT